MADIATVFHWEPPVMDAMSLAELLGWRRRAAKRNNPET